MARRLALIFLITFGFAANSFAAGESCVRVFKASKSLSQKVRDNTYHYWDFVRKNRNQYFPQANKYEGLVAGDTHPGNFIYSRLNGQMRLFFADIKDSGRAPYIYDLARLVASTHAILRGDASLHQTSRKMLDAYISGLAGQRMAIPSSVEARMNMTLRDYSELEQDYVEKKTRHDEFKIKPGKLERVEFEFTNPPRFQKLESDIQRIVNRVFQNAEVLDIAFRPRERGGSQEMLRYWALVHYRGHNRILEFKEVGDPATLAFGPQDNHQARLESAMNMFWPDRDPLFQTVTLDGGTFFMRPKKADVFRVPYKLKSQDDIDFTQDLAMYEAYLLGGMHARQRTHAYALDLDNVQSATLEDLVRFTRDYLVRLEEEVDHAREAGHEIDNEEEGEEE